MPINRITKNTYMTYQDIKKFVESLGSRQITMSEFYNIFDSIKNSPVLEVALKNCHILNLGKLLENARQNIRP